MLFYVLFALTSTAASCTLIGTGTGTGQDVQVIPSTSFKFYGENSVSLNVTRSPVVQLGSDDEDTNALCSGYYNKNIQGYAGRVVAVNTDKCESFVALYTKLSELNALAVLISCDENDIPGRTVFIHDSSKGLSTRYHSMPFLNVAVQDVSTIVDAIRAGNVVILESTPNQWLKIYESLGWIFLLRVLPALMSFATAFAALHSLVRNNFNHQQLSLIFFNVLNGDLAVRDVVLLIEAVAMGVLTIVFGLGPYFTGDAIDFFTMRFFLTGLTGVGLFTSTMLQLQLYSVRHQDNPIENASITKPLKDYGRSKVACIAAVTIGFDFLVGSSFSLLPIGGNRPYIYATASLVLVLQLGVAVSFTHAYISALWRRQNESQHHQPIFEFKKWLAVSGFCMFLHSIAIFWGLVYNFSGSPNASCGNLAFLSITRISISLAQVRAVRLLTPHHALQLEPLEMGEISSPTPQPISTGNTFSFSSQSSGSSPATLPSEQPSHGPIEDQPQCPAYPSELGNVHSTESKSTSSPEPCPTTPDIEFEFARLGGARHSRIMKKVANSDVAAINFNIMRGGLFRVSTASDTTRIHVVAFLQTTVQGGSTTWLETLRKLSPNSTFSVSRLRLGVDDIYFDVRVDVPYEGEVLVCIKETSTIVSTLEELNRHLQKDNENAKKNIDREREMLQESEGKVKSDGSDTEGRAASVSTDCVQKAYQGWQSRNMHETHRRHSGRKYPPTSIHEDIPTSEQGSSSSSLCESGAAGRSYPFGGGGGDCSTATEDLSLAGRSTTQHPYVSPDADVQILDSRVKVTKTSALRQKKISESFIDPTLAVVSGESYWENISLTLDDLRADLNSAAEKYIDEELITLKSSVGKDPVLTLEQDGDDKTVTGTETISSLSSATATKKDTRSKASVPSNSSNSSENVPADKTLSPCVSSCNSSLSSTWSTDTREALDQIIKGNLVQGE